MFREKFSSCYFDLSTLVAASATVQTSYQNLNFCLFEIINLLAYPQFQIAYAIIFLLVLDLHAGKVLRGQVDRAVGSVDNIEELVQRLPWISVVYGSPCTVGSRIVRVKSYKNHSYLLSSKDRETPVHIKWYQSYS